MSRAPGKTAMDVYRADLDRVSTLAKILTDEGPGRFGTAETLRWLLDRREEYADVTIWHAQGAATDSPDRAVTEAGCPQCGASPGDKCVGPDGRRAPGLLIHAARSKAWLAAS